MEKKLALGAPRCFQRRRKRLFQVEIFLGFLPRDQWSVAVLFDGLFQITQVFKVLNTFFEAGNRSTEFFNPIVKQGFTHKLLSDLSQHKMTRRAGKKRTLFKKRELFREKGAQGQSDT